MANTSEKRKEETKKNIFLTKKEKEKIQLSEIICSAYQHGSVEWPQHHHAYNLANHCLAVHEGHHKVAPEKKGRYWNCFPIITVKSITSQNMQTLIKHDMGKFMNGKREREREYG